MDRITNVKFFPWSIGYNPKEKMTLVVGLSLFIELISPYLFGKKTLLSIASADGKPTAVDKASKINPRPGRTRVKVITIQ